MKNILSVFVMLLVVVGLGACQSPPVEEESTQFVTTVAQNALPTAVSTRTPQPTPTAVSAPPTLTPIPLTSPNNEDEVENDDEAEEGDNQTITSIDPTSFGQGALVSLRMDSSVGVLLQEFPAEMRNRVAADLLNQPEDIWLTRAERQIELTYNRLHFRDFAYRKAGDPNPKKQLPWPPRDLWQIELTSEPYEADINGKRLVMVDYRWTTTLLSDADSPARAEPALATEGGVWREPFTFPADPTQLLQRTGNACLNEGGFPPNSYDSENVFTFYDYTCQGEDGGPDGCHRTQLNNFACTEAIDLFVGRVDTAVVFTRLPWDSDLADQVRRGRVSNLDSPDLEVIAEELSNHRITYRYFPPDSCALNEACIGNYGWRRLLKFDAVVHNIGPEALHIGEVIGENDTNLFKYDSCHDHYHYSNYGDFLFGLAPKPNKRAFCVESTGRFSNNEASPLTHDYSCTVQGIEAGWVDEYGAGLDCQWIDITDIVTATAVAETLPLTFRSNTDELLCEGQPVLDENGEQQWAWSGLYNEDGLPIAYPVCDLVENWDSNNEGTVPVFIPPTGSFVTEPCQSGEIGPRRNCDFTEQATDLTCTPGQQLTMRCELTPEVGQEPAGQVVRLCETSALLGTGTACTYEQALASLIVPTNAPLEFNFTCPFVRDEQELGGLYSFYTAPAMSSDPAQGVRCEVVSP